ncbi:MAG TPA: c-type cytochrome [Flavitalea sp.]|nr:c-type cytochrome [Flavitalea sp.]
MKKLLAISAIVLFTAISLSFINVKEDPGYKNLKVLPKNTTHDQMDSVMKHFAKSLGVKCNFCHVRNADTKKMDFVSDENKNKDIARAMMKMTNKINKKYFGHEGVAAITCYSCHNGKQEPSLFPPADEDDE